METDNLMHNVFYNGSQACSNLGIWEGDRLWFMSGNLKLDCNCVTLRLTLGKVTIVLLLHVWALTM